MDVEEIEERLKKALEETPKRESGARHVILTI